MRTTIIIAATTALTLAACGGTDTDWRSEVGDWAKSAVATELNPNMADNSLAAAACSMRAEAGNPPVEYITPEDLPLKADTLTPPGSWGEVVEVMPDLAEVPAPLSATTADVLDAMNAGANEAYNDWCEEVL